MKHEGIAALGAILLLVMLGFAFSPSLTGQGYFRSVSIPAPPQEYISVPFDGIPPYQPEGDYYSIPPIAFGNSDPGEPYRYRIVEPNRTLPTDFIRPKMRQNTKFVNYSPIIPAAPMYLNSYEHCMDQVKENFEMCQQSYYQAMEQCPTNFTCGAIAHTYHTCYQFYLSSQINCKRLYSAIAHNTSHTFPTSVVPRALEII